MSKEGMSFLEFVEKKPKIEKNKNYFFGVSVTIGLSIIVVLTGMIAFVEYKKSIKEKYFK